MIQHSTPESNKLLIDLINSTILRHTVQIFYKSDKGRRPYGSGVLLVANERHFLLTAAHVVEHLFKGNNLYLRVGANRFIPIIGKVRATESKGNSGIDVAYVELDIRLIKLLSVPYTFLTIENIRAHHKLVDAGNYCVVGFPEKNLVMVDGKIDTGASFYVTSNTNNKPYEYYKLSKEDFIIVDIKGKGMNLKTNNVTSIDSRFHGISGSGLWLIIVNLDPNTDQLWADYRLIGIMTEFRKGKYFCLIGNKIHLIMNAFQNIEGMSFNTKKPDQET